MALNYGGSYNLMRFPGFRLKAVTLSYDDGLKTDARLVDIMTKYGLKGTFNLNSSHILNGVDKDRLLSKKDALILFSSSGMEVAAHCGCHLFVDKGDAATAIKDLIKDRVALEDTFQTIVKGLAYPLGTLSEESTKIAKSCGFSYVRTINETQNFDLPNDGFKFNPTTSNTNPRFLELTEEFLSIGESKYFWFNEPRLFYLWRHTFEFSRDKDWSKMEDFAKLVGSVTDVWHATNIEIFDYVRAFKRLQFSAEGTFVYNPSAIDVYIKYFNGKNIVVPAGNTIKLI